MTRVHRISLVACARVIFGALLVAVLAWDVAWAQIIPKGEYRNLRRAKVWTGLTNFGQHGPDRDGSRRTSTDGVNYPGRNRLTGSLWSARQWPGARTHMQRYLNRTSTARNLGTYIITKPDPAEYKPDGAKTYNVSFSGLSVSSDITPVRYPIESMPEGVAGVGFEHLHPVAELPMASWWADGGPHLDANKVLEIHNNDFGKYMKPEHKRFGEVLGISHWTTETGITGTKKIYQWSFRDYDDFIIVENIFENTGDTDGDGVADLNGGAGLTLDDTYFSFYNYFWPTEGGTSNFDIGVIGGLGFQVWLLRWPESRNYEIVTDDVYRYTEAPNYMAADPVHADVADAIGLKMSYAFDWDSPLTAWDDVGDPHVPEIQCCRGRQNFQERGEIMAGQYVGVIPLDWDPTDGFANDNETYVPPRVMDQPFAVPWFPHKEEPEINRHSEDEIALALVSVTRLGERPSMFNLDGRTGWPENPTEPLPVENNPSRSGETADVPRAPNWYAFAHTYGPYDLKPGDKVKIVMAFVAAMPVEENMWGWQHDNIPQNQADLKTDKAMQNLIKHARKARELYDLEYDVPLPPPDVLMTKKNTSDATVDLTWGSLDDLEDPDYAGTPEAKDVAGYRVYRSDFYVDNWKLLKDIPRGDPTYYDPSTDKYTFVDETALSGFQYYFAVTAYDTGHNDFKGRGPVPSLESGLSAAEQVFRYEDPPFSPAVASNVEANMLERKVKVVPNPFLADGTHAYTGSDKIRFVNLPAKCNVKVFSVSGNFVAEFTHDNLNIGEASFFQETREVSGLLSPGLYFFVVESEMPESLGEIQRGTFVVVGGITTAQ